VIRKNEFSFIPEQKSQERICRRLANYRMTVRIFLTAPIFFGKKLKMAFPKAELEILKAGLKGSEEERERGRDRERDRERERGREAAPCFHDSRFTAHDSPFTT
jgi:hypothetical protein